jgi:hypothetical protein
MKSCEAQSRVPVPEQGLAAAVGRPTVTRRSVLAHVRAFVMGISLCTWSLWGWFFLSILDCF